jgi:hypothetical protein
MLNIYHLIILLMIGNKNVKGTHEPSIVFINCIPPTQIKYIKKKKCSNHPPEQVCNECIPHYVILIDILSVVLILFYYES